MRDWPRPCDSPALEIPALKKRLAAVEVPPRGRAGRGRARPANIIEVSDGGRRGYQTIGPSDSCRTRARPAGSKWGPSPPPCPRVCRNSRANDLHRRTLRLGWSRSPSAQGPRAATASRSRSRSDRRSPWSGVKVPGTRWCSLDLQTAAPAGSGRRIIRAARRPRAPTIASEAARRQPHGRCGPRAVRSPVAEPRSTRRVLSENSRVVIFAPNGPWQGSWNTPFPASKPRNGLGRIAKRAHAEN